MKSASFSSRRRSLGGITGSFAPMKVRISGRVLTLALLLGSSPSFALNESTTIVLHARDGFAACDEPQQSGLDCVNGHPVLDIGSMQMPWIYVMLHNYDNLNVVQMAFDWPIAWTYLGGTWDCRPGALVVIQPTAPGPLTGTALLAFNCIQGGSLATVGRMIFAPPVGGGCLSIIQSAYQDGTCVVDCSSVQITTIAQGNLGRVCAGPGGHDACWPAATAVESTTWGGIKNQYR